jgi:hypothetical protein
MAGDLVPYGAINVALISVLLEQTYHAHVGYGDLYPAVVPLPRWNGYARRCC